MYGAIFGRAGIILPPRLCTVETRETRDRTCNPSSELRRAPSPVRTSVNLTTTSCSSLPYFLMMVLTQDIASALSSVEELSDGTRDAIFGRRLMITFLDWKSKFDF